LIETPQMQFCLRKCRFLLAKKALKILLIAIDVHLQILCHPLWAIFGWGSCKRVRLCSLLVWCRTIGLFAILNTCWASKKSQIWIQRLFLINLIGHSYHLWEFKLKPWHYKWIYTRVTTLHNLASLSI